MCVCVGGGGGGSGRVWGQDGCVQLIEVILKMPKKCVCVGGPVVGDGPVRGGVSGWMCKNN